MEFSRPGYYEKVLTSFPQLTIVLAHMGVGADDRYPELYRAYYDEALSIGKRYPNLYFDMSFTVDVAMPDEDLLTMIRQLGAERVIFGSDFAWFEPALVARALDRLPLTKEEKQLIFARNAERVYGL